MGRLRGGDLARMAWRTSLLQATWNYERQQGLGWAWALEPALDRLYPDAEERRQRLAEHTAYFNTQPTLASLALGAAAGLEERRAEGEGPDADAMSHIKGVLASSLAALGDRLFWFSLRPFVACLGILLALERPALGAAVLWTSYNLVHLTVRFGGVGWGYRGGPAALGTRVRPRLETLTRALHPAGAVLVGVLVAAFLVPGGDPRPMAFQALLGLGLGAGLLTAQRARPSPTTWALAVGALCWVLVWLRG